MFAPDRLTLDLNKGVPTLAGSTSSDELFVNYLDSSRLQKARPSTAEKRFPVDLFVWCLFSNISVCRNPASASSKKVASSSTVRLAVGSAC